MKPVMVPVSNDFIKSEKYLIAKVCGRGGWYPKLQVLCGLFKFVIVL